MYLQFTSSDLARFWAKVEKTDLCWNWIAAHNTLGYGLFYISKRLHKAHRVSYCLHYGELPDDLFVCHKCDNPRCVRPDHLFAGTRMDNLNDMISKGRGKKGPIENKENFKWKPDHALRLHPELRARGERHGSKTHPECVLRGKDHPFTKDPSKCLWGEAHQNCKVKDADVLEIKRRYAEGGISMKKLGQEYGVSASYVNMVMKGRLRSNL